MDDTLFRFDYHGCLEVLLRRIEEPAPSRIQLLTGPRQVGKTTLLLELAGSLGDRAIYAAADSPEASLPGHWERMWAKVDAMLNRTERIVVLLDEVHRLPDWAARLKAEWDRLRRTAANIHVIATGSSALDLTWGSHESLAGRFERLTLSHWSAAALAARFGLPKDEAVMLAVQKGTYPGGMPLVGDPARWTAYVRDAVVEPAISRDILELADVRRPGLLRQVFAACTVSPAQILSLQKMQGRLRDPGALETIAHYLHLLEEAYLVSALDKHSGQPLRRRAAPPKLVVLNNALLAAMDPRGIPDAGTEPARFGAWVENACLAYAWNAGQQVRYWRREPFEVDAVLEGSWGRWALEVKTGMVESEDLRGLAEFTRLHPDYSPLLLCDPEQTGTTVRWSIPTLSWPEFLWSGPAAATPPQS